MTTKHKYKVGDHVYMYDPDYICISRHGIIKTAGRCTGRLGYEITPDKYENSSAKYTLWFWQDEVTGLYKEKQPKHSIKKKQQYVYVVHQFGWAKLDTSDKHRETVISQDHKILGVYNTREGANKAKYREQRYTKDFNNPYIAVTRHRVKGAPE